MPQAPRLTFDPRPLDSEKTPALSKRTDLFEAYLGKDIRPLKADMDERPQHYTDAQRELVRRIEKDEPTHPGERAELVLRLLRRTEAQKTERQVRSRMTRQAIEPEGKPPAFEEQDLFRGAIKLI